MEVTFFPKGVSVMKRRAKMMPKATTIKVIVN